MKRFFVLALVVLINVPVFAEQTPAQIVQAKRTLERENTALEKEFGVSISCSATTEACLDAINAFRNLPRELSMKKSINILSISSAYQSMDVDGTLRVTTGITTSQLRDLLLNQEVPFSEIESKKARFRQITGLRIGFNNMSALEGRATLDRLLAIAELIPKHRFGENEIGVWVQKESAGLNEHLNVGVSTKQTGVELLQHLTENLN